MEQERRKKKKEKQSVTVATKRVHERDGREQQQLIWSEKKNGKVRKKVKRSMER